MTETNIPPQVDFARRYFAGDWTEREVPPIREAWVCGEDDTTTVVWHVDGDAYGVIAFDGEGNPHFTAVELNDDGTFTITQGHYSSRCRVTDEGVIEHVPAEGAR